MAEPRSLEDERTKILTRLANQTTDKCRHRTFFELAMVEARMVHTENAISALREAIACGLDAVYAKELRTSLAFTSLQTVPDFQLLLQNLEGKDETLATTTHRFTYAKGEKERCVAEALICTMCNEPFVEPNVHVDCGHMFCHACIAPCASCPQCHGSVNQTGALVKQTARIILNKLDALKCHCVRCQRTFERATLAAHVDTCPILCKCRQKIAPSLLAEHIEHACTAVLVACPGAEVGCPWRDKRGELKNHKRSCKYAIQLPLLTRMNALEEMNRSLREELQTVQRRLGRLEDTTGDGENNHVH